MNDKKEEGKKKKGKLNVKEWKEKDEKKKKEVGYESYWEWKKKDINEVNFSRMTN